LTAAQAIPSLNQL